MDASKNQALLQHFYQAFKNADAESMKACYHPKASFEDPAFGKLNAQEVGAMWSMLFERAAGDLEIEYNDAYADSNTGSAHWIAVYHFGKNKRRVLNEVRSAFTFSQGKILDQQDEFNLWKWSRQALGLTGFLIGWSPIFRKKMQKKSKSILLRYMKKNKL